MELLNRVAQKEILLKLAGCYPQEYTFLNGDRDNTTVVNVAYLEECGLVKIRWVRPVSSPHMPDRAKITARGLDFLSDDGGLTAVLGVVTVRLSEDTIKALLVDKVDASGAPPDAKAALKEQIRTLPAEAVKTIATKLIEKGLDVVPDAAAFIQRFLTG